MVQFYLNCCGDAAMSGRGGGTSRASNDNIKLQTGETRRLDIQPEEGVLFVPSQQATVRGMKISSKIVGSKVPSPPKKLTMNIDALFFANGLGGMGAVIHNYGGERLCSWCLLASPKAVGRRECRGNCIAERFENGGGPWLCSDDHRN